MELALLSDTSAGATFEGAEQDLRAALALDPNLAQAWFALGALLGYTGNPVEGERATRQAYNVDAYLLEARAVVVSLYFSGLNLERFDDARAWCEVGQERWPHDINVESCRLRLLGWAGRTAQDVAAAWSQLTAIERLGPPSSGSLGWEDRRLLVAAAAARAGRGDSARAILRRTLAVVDSATQLEMAPEEAWVWLLLGERPRSLRLLAENLRVNPANRRYIAESPWFRPLHDSPDFKSLVGRAP
jgi:tetratricopeptide (TPR) repeat protein